MYYMITSKIKVVKFFYQRVIMENLYLIILFLITIWCITLYIAYLIGRNNGIKLMNNIYEKYKIKL